MAHWKKVESYELNLIWKNFTGMLLRVKRLLILLYVKEIKKRERNMCCNAKLFSE